MIEHRTMLQRLRCELIKMAPIYISFSNNNTTSILTIYCTFENGKNIFITGVPYTSQ